MPILFTYCATPYSNCFGSGFWTDNGAYYYYQTEEGMDYEETLNGISAYCEENDIPVRYLDLDSWWYFKGEGNGVKNWTAIPEVLPSGLAALAESTGWPLVAHNRYWSPDTDYAEQNQGEYEFFIEEENVKALPADEDFWIDLFADSASDWGLQVYEQDWQDRQFVDME